MAAMATTLLTPGYPAPWFKATTRHNPTYDFSSVAGRTIVLCLFGSAGRPETRAVLEGFGALRDLFDDDRCAFFGVSVDSADADLPCWRDPLPGVRFFQDHDRRVSRLYGACDEGDTYRPHTLVLDERPRVLAVLPFLADQDHAASVRTAIKRVTAMPRTIRSNSRRYPAQACKPCVSPVALGDPGMHYRHTKTNPVSRWRSSGLPLTSVPGATQESHRMKGGLRPSFSLILVPNGGARGLAVRPARACRRGP